MHNLASSLVTIGIASFFSIFSNHDNHRRGVGVVSALVVPFKYPTTCSTRAFLSTRFSRAAGDRARWCSPPITASSSSSLSMSYVSDSSDYGGGDDTDYEDEGGGTNKEQASGPRYREFQDVPAVEAKPVPYSKNAGLRFLAVYYDAEVDTVQRTRWERHCLRMDLMQQHVLWARCANLYNDTVNTNSMADVVWSYPLLSTQKVRVYGEEGQDTSLGIGHAICIDSNSLSYAQELLSKEPILQALTNVDTFDPPYHEDILTMPSPLTTTTTTRPPADLSKVKLFRWRHIKDHSLRQDDGMLDMTPWIIIALDRPNQHNLRAATNRSHVEYLIDSERIVMAGPLYAMPTNSSSSSSSSTTAAEGATQPAVGNFMVVNALDRDEAVQFAENDPCALAGLYESMRVHDYNAIDVSGKFVTVQIGDQDKVRGLMKSWGYPLNEDQTAWINS